MPRSGRQRRAAGLAPRVRAT